MYCTLTHPHGLFFTLPEKETKDLFDWIFWIVGSILKGIVVLFFGCCCLVGCVFLGLLVVLVEIEKVTQL